MYRASLVGALIVRAAQIRINLFKMGQSASSTLSRPRMSHIECTIVWARAWDSPQRPGGVQVCVVVVWTWVCGVANIRPHPLRAVLGCQVCVQRNKER